MAVDPCQVVDALAAANLDILKRINRKFAALRGLAQLLEQLGNLDDLVPNIGALIPVIRVDLAIYENLVANCPYLNLPPFTTGDLNQLQVQLTGAYANYFNKLLRHPWNRMGQLQEQMDNWLGQVQGGINSALTQTSDFFRCLQTVCAAGRAVAGQLNALSNADIGKEIGIFAENFANNAGNVLTDGMKLKYQQILDGQTQLRALGADVGQDYAAAKAALGK
jgi:hypothetical protein